MVFKFAVTFFIGGSVTDDVKKWKHLIYNRKRLFTVQDASSLSPYHL